MRRTLGIGALAVLSTGCFYPADRARLLEAKVDRLAADNLELQSRQQSTQTQLEGTLPRIDEKIAQVTQTLETLDKASRRSGADIGVQLEKTVADVAMLRGQVETYQFKLNELDTSLKTLQDDNQRKLAANPEAAAQAETRKKSEELERPADKKAFLALAAQKAQAGEARLARQLYGEFMKKWPKDELIGEAHFGLGELALADNDCRAALFEYGKVMQDYAKARSAPEAYLRSSDCFATLKMKDESRLALEELTRRYPDSAAGKDAKSRLAELDRAAKKGTKGSGKKGSK